VITPILACVRHAVIDFGSLAKVAVFCLFRNFHRAVEVLSSSVEISLLSEDLSKLHEGSTFTLAILEFTGEFKVTLYEHLEFLGVHLGVDLIASHFTEVSNSDALASHTRHLNGVAEGELMVNRRLFVVTRLVVNDTQVDVGQEFARNICHLLVSSMIVDGVRIH